MARIHGNPANQGPGSPFGGGDASSWLRVAETREAPIQAQVWGPGTMTPEPRIWRGGGGVSSAPVVTSFVQDQAGGSITDQAGSPLS